jgi:hypothetical protein
MVTKVKQLQTNVEEDKKDSSREIVQREAVKDTPFTVISYEGYHFGVIGEHRITEKYNDKKVVIKKLKEFSWNRVIQVLMILDNQKEKLAQVKTNK